MAGVHRHASAVGGAVILAAPIADALRDIAHDMRLRQAIVVSAVLRSGPLEVTHRDVYDSAAHDLDVQRTPTGYSVALKPAPN